MNVTSDQTLLQWILSEDLQERDQAFTYIYKVHYPAIQQYVTRNKGSADEAKDIFQDGLIVLYNQIQKGAFEGRSQIKTYLFAICRNLWLKKITRNPTPVDLPEHQDIADFNPDALNALVGTEKEECVARLLDKIGKECNKLIRYYYYDKLSMKNIMATLNLASEQVAKNKKMKCMKRLRNLVLESSLYTSLLKS